MKRLAPITIPAPRVRYVSDGGFTIQRGPTTRDELETVIVPYKGLRDLLDQAFEQLDQRTPEGKIVSEVIYALQEQLRDMFWQRPDVAHVRDLKGPCGRYAGEEPGDECLDCGWESHWHERKPAEASTDAEDPEPAVADTAPALGTDTNRVDEVVRAWACWHGTTPPCADCSPRGTCSSCRGEGPLTRPGGVCTDAQACNRRLCQLVQGIKKDPKPSSDDELPF